ncbi:MAG: hypothetical protein Q9195_000195 [Heterodermia aff. obscurata]
MDIFEIPDAKRIRRADLQSDSLSSEHSNLDLRWEYREYLTRHYTTTSEPATHDIDFKNLESQSRDVEQAESKNAEEYEFQLFSKPKQPTQSLTRNKVLLRSPSPPSASPGFINVRRPDTYYFTGQLKKELQAQYQEAAISSLQLLQALDPSWPGSELPWRVIVIKATDAKKAIAALPLVERSNVKKKRCGKKRRIAIRKKTAGKAEKERLAKMSQADKEAAEKEKRTRRNREKKVKKRSPQYFPPGVPLGSIGAAFQIAECNNTNFFWYCCDGNGNGTCCDDPENDLGIVQGGISNRASAPVLSQTELIQVSSAATQSIPLSTAVLTETSAQKSTFKKASSTVVQSITSSTTAPTPTPDEPVSQINSTSTTIAPSQRVSSSSSTTLQPDPTVSAAPLNQIPSRSNHTVTIGVATAGSILAVLILFGVLACMRLQRHPPEPPPKSQQKQQHYQDPEKQMLHPADIRSSRAAPLSDWGEETLIDAAGPPVSSTQSNSRAAPDTAELSDPTTRRLPSLPSPLIPSPLSIPTRDHPTPLRTPSPFTPLPSLIETDRPPELESSFDIAPISPRSPPPPRPAPPPPCELEARDGVTVAALHRRGSSSPSNHHRARPPTRGGRPLSTIMQSPHSSASPSSVSAERPWNGSSGEEGIGREPVPGYGAGARGMGWGVDVERPATTEESRRGADLEPGAEAKAWSNWL